MVPGSLVQVSFFEKRLAEVEAPSIGVAILGGHPGLCRPKKMEGWKAYVGRHQKMLPKGTQQHVGQGVHFDGQMSSRVTQETDKQTDKRQIKNRSKTHRRRGGGNGAVFPLAKRAPCVRHLSECPPQPCLCHATLLQHMIFLNR